MNGVKFILLPFLWWLILTPGSDLKAQRRFEAHLTGGVTMAQIDGDQLVGYNKFGFQGGLGVQTILSERWAVGFDLLFTQQGSSRSLNDNVSAVFDKIRLNLVEVPVLLYFTDWKFEVGAGLSYARLINFEAIDISGADVSDTQSFRNDLFAPVVGIAFHFTDAWALETRWSKYISNLQADPNAGTFLGKHIAVRLLYTL